MQDIALEAGVGKATVSLALRDDPRIRPETRERIKKVAERLGYRSNPTVANLMAQLRASREPKFQATLAFINACPHDSQLKTLATFQNWLGGVRERAHERGYEIDYFWLHDPTISAGRQVKILQSRSIKGIIFAAVFDDDAIDQEHHILFPDFASVVIGRKLVAPSPHYACNDQYDSIYSAVSEIKTHGYNKIGLVLVEEMDRAVEYRFSAGFGAAHAQKGEPMAPFLYFTDEASFAAWYLAHRPDAILTDKPILREWLKNLSGGAQTGLAHLDWDPKLIDWAGINQNNHQVGMAAVDLLIGQLHRNECGLPPYPRSIMIGATWQNGESLPKKLVGA